MTITETRKLFVYTEWANNLVLDAGENLTTEQLTRDVQISYKSILGTLLHMAGADWLWMERWAGNSPVGPDIWNEWKLSESTTLQQVRNQWQPIIRRRNSFLAEITDADLTREFAYKRFTGETYALPLGEQLQHVVNHTTLHRGQVVGMIRQLGITPPATDFLFYLMEMKAKSSSAK